MFCRLVLFMTLACLVSATWAVPFGFSVRESDQTLVRINLSTGAIKEIGDTDPSDTDDIDGLAFDSNGVLYGSDNDQDRLYTINLATGAKTEIASFSQTIDDSGLAMDSSDTLYLSDGTDEDLFTVNLTTAQLSLVGNHGEDITAIAFDAMDTLYAINDSDNELVTLDVTNGMIATVIGSLGISTSGSQGMSFDQFGNLFMVDEGSESLYSIDTNTGAATFIADLGADFETIAIIDVELPLPGVLWLIGAGLVGLGYRLQRRRTA